MAAKRKPPTLKVSLTFKNFVIVLKNSRRPKHYVYYMKGKNGEKMMSSELIENTTYLKQLMKRFQDMGFVTLNYTKLKLS